MPPDVLPRLLERLSDPAFHGLPPDSPVQHRQTHISHVFLAGDRVLKLKKPVDFGFLDFTTLAKREAACHAEVHLNKRLARDVYLGAEPITETADGDFTLGGADEVVEWAVVMRRLDDDAHLAARLKRGEDVGALLPHVVERLVRFYTTAATDADIQIYGRSPTVIANWDENLQQTADMVGELLTAEEFSTIAAGITRFLDMHGPALDARADDGFVADLHGDLRCEHIFIEGDAADYQHGITIIDCIEFNQRFRCCDAVNDLAFLGMDLDRLGAPNPARNLVAAYAQTRPDPGAYALWDFFKCYRAYVRGKVNGFTAREPEVPEDQRRAAAGTARLAFSLAADYARRFVRPPCIVVSGPIGCGKSTVARALATHADLVAINTDVVRKALAGVAPAARVTEEGSAGLYNAVATERTYLAVIDRGRDVLETGRGIVLDGTFSTRSARVAARKMASDVGAEFVLVQCTLDPDENRRRLRTRLADAGRVSDARSELLDQHLRDFEPIAPAEARRMVTCDLADPVAAVEHTVLQRVFLH